MRRRPIHHAVAGFLRGRARKALETTVKECNIKPARANKQPQSKITGHERAGVRLSEVERCLPILLDNLHMVAVALDLEGNVAYANPCLLELTGYTLDEVLGKNWFQTFIPERDRPAPDTPSGKILETGHHPHDQALILSRDGEERLIDWNNTVLFDERGKPGGTVSVGEDVTEHAQAEQALQRRNLELAALNTVAQTLSASLGLQDLLDRALSSTVSALGFAAGCINLADEHTGDLALASHTGLPLPMVEHLETHGVGGTLCDPASGTDPVSGTDLVYREGTTGCLPSADAQRLLQAGLRSYTGAAIVYQDQALGTLCLFDTKPHPVSETDHVLLTAICQQIGVAVENARLFGDVAREREVAQTLLNTAEALSTTLQLDKLLERVLDELQRVVPYDAASIIMLREASPPPGGGSGDSSPTGMSPSTAAWIVASRGMERIPSKTGMSPSTRTLLKEIPPVAQVVRERGPVIVPDVHGGTDWLAVEGLDPDRDVPIRVRSWLGVPLISKDKVIGVLVVDSHRPDTYDEGTARLAFAFAHQAALAIENARLYEQTRAQLREATLLHSVTVALSSTLDIEQILPYMARSLCKILNSTSVQIYSLDEAAKSITVVADYAASEATEKEHRSELGRTYAFADFPGEAAGLIQDWDVPIHRRPVQIQVDGPELDPRAQGMLEARGAQASLLLPMVTRDHVVGCAQVWDSQGPHRFTEGEIAVGQTLIQPAAIALENAHLFEETQRRVSELQFLHDVGLAAAAGVRLEDTLQAAAEALAAAMEGTHVAILLLESEGSTLRLEAGIGYPPDLIGNLRLELGQGITGYVARYGQPALVPDVRLDPRYYEGTPDTRSELCVPLVVGPWVIGVLNVESPQPNAFTVDDQRLLSTLASNLAVLVERARLFEEVEAARTELQQRAEALEEANVRLQELDRLKDEFLASMSHELRTPLNSIIGFSEVLVDGLLGEMSDEQKEGVQNIHAGGEHLLALINDILDLSKIEAGRMALELTTFDVVDLLVEAEAATKPLVEKKSQVLTVERDGDLPRLIADRTRIKQVLLNLLSNAYKFTPTEGHITLSCRLADPSTILFSVADDGIGIKSEDQEIVFEEFRQVDGSHAREMTGTGLGLAISKRLVEMHGGQIWLESEYGHGATFSFQLALGGPPAAEPEPSDQATSP